MKIFFKDSIERCFFWYPLTLAGFDYAVNDIGDFILYGYFDITEKAYEYFDCLWFNTTDIKFIFYKDTKYK